MISKYNACRVGVSVGLAATIIAILIVTVLYADYLVGVMSFVMSTPFGVGALAMFFAAMMIYGFVNEGYHSSGAIMLFVMGTCGYVTELIIVMVDYSSSQPVLPSGSLWAVVPSVVMILASIFYFGNYVRICDRYGR